MSNNCDSCENGGDVPVIELQQFINLKHDAFKQVVFGQHIICLKLSKKYGAMIMMPKNSKNSCFVGYVDVEYVPQ